jgi:hypothetical protein
MTYTVQFQVGLDAVPDGALREIRRTMAQIAEAVTTIPGASPFWLSMKDSLLQIDVEDWRVVYRVEPGRREIHVIELAHIGR